MAMDTTSPIPDFHTEPLEAGTDDRRTELEQARRLAERYRLEFVDMDTFRIDQDLFRSIPADLMQRYGFVPYRRDGKTLVIGTHFATPSAGKIIKKDDSFRFVLA